MLSFTMMFELNDKGWSETHYWNSNQTTDLIASDGTLTPLALALVTTRLGIMTNNGQTQFGQPDFTRNPILTRIRVSNLGLFRVVRIWEPATLADGLGTYKGPEIAANSETVEPWTRLDVIADLVDQNNRAREGHIYLGGVPEAELQSPSIFNPTPTYTTALNNYFAQLTGSAFNAVPWQTKLRQYASDPISGGFAAVPITSFTPAPNGLSAQLQGAITGQAGLPTTGQIVIRGRHPSQWNGVHRYALEGTAPNQFLLLGPARQPLGDFAPLVGPAVGIGTVQSLLPNFATYTTLAADIFRSRKTGRPFGLSPGRRKRPE